jgi:hypothetical protein
VQIKALADIYRHIQKVITEREIPDSGRYREQTLDHHLETASQLVDFINQDDCL